ncbi:MAG: hypothetical protein LBQ62_01675, partial [Candidatus Accumulibacter sp.]|nr:hypothetical protein [Accumulibacter sp.]
VSPVGGGHHALAGLEIARFGGSRPVERVSILSASWATPLRQITTVAFSPRRKGRESCGFRRLLPEG